MRILCILTVNGVTTMVLGVGIEREDHGSM